MWHGCQDIHSDSSVFNDSGNRQRSGLERGPYEEEPLVTCTYAIIRAGLSLAGVDFLSELPPLL
jgi:hypothetical protein